MARSNMKLHDEAGYIDAGPLAHHKIALATHGRSIHRVKTHRQPGVPPTSASGGKPDIDGANPDIGSAMSSFGGKPDVTEGEP